GSGSFKADPQFVNATARNLHLKESSPSLFQGTAIDSYDATYQASFGVSMLRDFDVNPRDDEGFWDIGADTFRAPIEIHRGFGRAQKIPISTLEADETAGAGYTLSTRAATGASDNGGV